MKASIEQIQERFASLTQREKQMVVGALLLTIWGGWDNLLNQPWQQKDRATQGDIVSLQNQLQTQQQIAKQLAELAGHNPNNLTREKLTHLQQSIAGLKNELNLGEKKFISSQEMADALRDMLTEHGNLKLVKLETLPVSAFGDNVQQPAWVYRHTLAITLQGDYFSTLNYLKALESLPWRIHWDSISYKVKDYPLAETRIQVYTLSFEQEWLGV